MAKSTKQGVGFRLPWNHEDGEPEPPGGNDNLDQLQKLTMEIFSPCERSELRIAISTFDVWEKLRKLYPSLHVEDVEELLIGLQVQNTIIHGEASWLLIEVEAGY